MVNETFTLEKYALNSYNYFENMVDKNGLPYFNVFWTEPAEAAHDWPDFGDVMARQLQGAIMGRYMTGEESKIEKLWYKKVISLINPQDGLLYRPQTNYSQYTADMGDQTLTLYALVTAYLDNHCEDLKVLVCKMVDSIDKRVRSERSNGVFASGFLIKSLMACFRYMGYEPALDLAGLIVERVFGEHSPLFTGDNKFQPKGHMHGNLRTLAGAADYALCVGDPVLYSRVNAIFFHVRSNTTKFGFLPEVLWREDDIVACETCALMDYIGTAVTLANHGHPEYWDDVERVVRNHLVESQLKDGSWLHPNDDKADTDQFTWQGIGERMLGGYAGWTSPNHILACRETLNAHWGGAELKDKTRAFQNCCGGSGTHAFFIAWKNASRYEHEGLSVNLHIDKLLPQAEIRCYQPYKGLLTIDLKQSCNVKIRIPGFTSAPSIKVQVNDIDTTFRVDGNFMDLGRRQEKDHISVLYPLELFEEEETIGNPGRRQYWYQVTWKGSTVVRMVPVPAANEYSTGYSEFDKKHVPVFYGAAGPGYLYQRDYMLDDAVPELSKIHLDAGKLDFWHF